MSKIEALTPINASYGGIAKLNAHLQKIENAFDNTLSRDGSSPNQLEADIDMNDNQLLNLGEPLLGKNAATKTYVDNNLATVLGLSTFLTNPSGAGVVYVSPEGVAIGPKVIFVDLYDDIYPDGSADSTAGLKALIAAQGRTNVEYVFSDSGSYKLYTTDAINTSVGYIVDAVATNFYLNFNGATITVGRPFTDTLNTFAFRFTDGSSGIRIGRHNFVQTNNRTWPAGFTAGGTWWLDFKDDVFGVHIEPIKAVGGLIIVNFSRGSDATKRVNNVYIESLDCRYVGYCVNGQNNGDNVFIGYLSAKEGARAILCYNWHGHLHIELFIEQDQYTQAHFLNNSSGSNLYDNDSTTGTLYLDHIGLVPTGLGGGLGDAFRLSVEQRGTGAGTMGPLHIKSRTQLDQAGALTQGFLNLLKTTSSGTPDPTSGRGHKMSLVIETEIHGAPAAEVMTLGKVSTGDWAGEDLLLIVDKLVVRGSTSADVNIDYDGMQTGPLLRYVDTVGTITETGTQSATCAKVVWRTSAGNNGNLVTEGRENTFSENQTVTKANARFTLNGTSGTPSTIQFGADSASTFFGSFTDAPVNLYHNSVIVAAIMAEGLRSEFSMLLKDGITAPSATAGYAKIFVDTADGDLKVIFGDGTVKTIVVDT